MPIDDTNDPVRAMPFRKRWIFWIRSLLYSFIIFMGGAVTLPGIMAGMSGNRYRLTLADFVIRRILDALFSSPYFWACLVVVWFWALRKFEPRDESK